MKWRRTRPTWTKRRRKSRTCSRRTAGRSRRSRKVAKVLRSDRCDCCTSQSSRIISELRQKKDESSEKLANMVRRNSEAAKLIAGLTVKQDALAPRAERTKLFSAVDPGACESVIDAAEQVPGYEVQETRASKSGLVYASATGEEIANLGGLFADDDEGKHQEVHEDASRGGVAPSRQR